MRAYDGAGLMTLVISTECANPPTLVGGSLVTVFLSGSTSPIKNSSIEGASKAHWAELEAGKNPTQSQQLLNCTLNLLFPLKLSLHRKSMSANGKS